MKRALLTILFIILATAFFGLSLFAAIGLVKMEIYPILTVISALIVGGVLAAIMIALTDVFDI